LICSCNGPIMPLCRVELHLRSFERNGEKAYIFIGQCEQCKKAFWGAEEFHWLLWMTPQQQWITLLEESRNAGFSVYDASEGRRAMIVIHDRFTQNLVKREFTIIFNRKGEVEYLTYHENSQ
jgi:hypothetical protein